MFASTKLKIERADHHIADLERQLAAFTRQNLDASVANRDDGKLDITLTVLSLPPDIALTIGDAVHNLWTALDHMTWEMIGPDGKHKQVYFPKGRDRPSYEGTCEGMKTSAVNKDILKSLEAFPGGKGEFLYIVHSLDRADKHSILTPIVHACGIDELALVADEGKVRLPLSDLYGGAATLREGETFTIDGAPSGSSLALKNDAMISPHILFGDVEFVKDQAIFPTIRQFRDAVAETIKIVDASLT
jgi:hypothetical protein